MELPRPEDLGLVAGTEEEGKEWVRMIAKVSESLELKETEDSLSTVNLSGQAGSRLAAYGGKRKKGKGKKKKKLGGRGRAGVKKKASMKQMS